MNRQPTTSQAMWRRTGIILCLALAAAGCRQTRDDIAGAVGFVQQANAISARPDETGAFPSPYQTAVGETVGPEQLTPAERTQAVADLKAAGAATTSGVRGREATLKALSPY